MFKVLAISLFYCSAANGQIIFKAKKFEATVWASSNRDSSFFKSDTIKLVKIGNNSTQEVEESNDIASYFKGNDFVTIELKKKYDLKLSITKVDTWEIINKKGSYKWRFNDKKRTLNLYFKNKLIASFTPLSEKNVEIKSNYVGRPVTKTKEITMRRNY